MKYWKKTMACAVLSLGALLTVASQYSTAAYMQDSEEKKLIQQSFLGAEQTALEFAKFDSKTGTTASLAGTELDACINGYIAKVERYYAKDNPCRQNYIENEEYLLKEVFDEKVDYTVDCGILDYEFKNIEIAPDYQTAVLEATYTVWCKWVEQDENGSFVVGDPINKNTTTATMVKEDGYWKLLEQDTQIEYGCDAEEQIMNNVNTLPISISNDIQAISDFQKIYNQGYSSFKDALAAANTIDEKQINPFSILTEMEKTGISEHQ